MMSKKNVLGEDMKKGSWIYTALVLLVVMVIFPARASAEGVKVYCVCNNKVAKVLVVQANYQFGVSCYTPIESMDSLLNKCRYNLCDYKCNGKNIQAIVNTNSIANPNCGILKSKTATCPDY